MNHVTSLLKRVQSQQLDKNDAHNCYSRMFACFINSLPAPPPGKEPPIIQHIAHCYTTYISQLLISLWS